MSGLTELLSKVINLGIAVDGILGEWNTRAAMVGRARAYYDGEHQAKMTDDMRRALRLAAGDYEFAENMMPHVVDSLTDRLQVLRIDADNPGASKWLEEVMEEVRFDLLQDSIHHSATLDGDTFAMVGFNSVRNELRITHEQSFDGVTGMMVLYFSDADDEPGLAIKVWQELIKQEKLVAMTRVNLYYADRIEKYAGEVGKPLSPYKDASGLAVLPWTDRAGQPLGVPVVHFAHKARGHFGISAINDAIPLQDALNRNLHSLIRASESSGWPLRVAYNFDPDPGEEGFAPGDWAVAATDDGTPITDARVETLESGDMSQLIGTDKHLVSRIGLVTATPTPEMFGSDSLSGEAFKTREQALVNKAKKFQLVNGARYERLFDKAWLVDRTFNTTRTAADYLRFRSRWRSAETRNDREIVQNAVSVAGTGNLSRRAFLMAVSPVFQWEQGDIELILTEVQAEQTANATRLMEALPNYRGFTPPTPADNVTEPVATDDELVAEAEGTDSTQ